jgi:hypothetical protein
LDTLKTVELYCKALYDYDTDQTDELSIKEGEFVRILNKDNADWWLAEKIGQSTASGLVPSNVSDFVFCIDVFADAIRSFLRQFI